MCQTPMLDATGIGPYCPNKKCGVMDGLNPVTKKAYKLLRVRKDGSIGPLFVNRRQRITIGEWLEAIDGKPKNLANRPGWHVTMKPDAPHLSMKDRRWYRVEVKDFYEMKRPEVQGGLWLIAKYMRVIGEVKK